MLFTNYESFKWVMDVTTISSEQYFELKKKPIIGIMGERYLELYTLKFCVYYILDKIIKCPMCQCMNEK